MGLDERLTDWRQSDKRLTRAAGQVLSFALGAALAIGVTLCLCVLATAGIAVDLLRWAMGRIGGRR